VTPGERRALFLRLAARTQGVTAQDVYAEGIAKGDDVSAEAYFNLARRLTHAGLMRADKTGDRTLYFAADEENSTWLDEDQLQSIIEPEYPLATLTAYRETLRQVRTVDEHVWIEIRERLRNEDARRLFSKAIRAYCDNLADEIKAYALERQREERGPQVATARRVAESSRQLLMSMVKDGLGLSKQAAGHRSRRLGRYVAAHLR
jgi:hypothetical protein